MRPAQMTVVINWRNSCLKDSGEVVWVPSAPAQEIGAGAALRPREVRELFLGFDAWEPSVRVAALRDVIASLEDDDDDQEGDIETPSMKWPDALVLRELEKGDPLLNAHDESPSWRRRVLAAARRNIHEATPALERLLRSAHPAPRARRPRRCYR